MDKGSTHSTEMGADKLAKITPNAPNCIRQFVCPSPKVWNFNEKRLQRVFVVRVFSLTAEWVVAHYVCNIASSDEAFVLGMRVSQT